MLVTANLVRDGRTLSDDVQFKCTGHVYNVSEEYRDWFGPEVAVVAGPHLDFSSLGSHDVYTRHCRASKATAVLQRVR